MPAARLPFAVPLALVLALAPASAGAAPAGRLAGASEVDPPGRYPFAAALVDRHTPDAWRGRFCDGAVIADRWVLTAARCLEDRRPGEVDVVVGRHDLTAGGGTRVAAAAFHIHPRHDGAEQWDAALVELAAPVTAAPVRLPAADLPPGPAVVVGWGDTREPDRLPRTLQMSRVPLLSDGECALIHGEGFSPAFMVCAGDLEEGGVGACRGDGGAPLFVEGPGGPVQVGIAGWGIGCALPGLPALYTRVAALAPWVQSVTGTGPLTCAGRAPTIIGTAGADVVTGTPGDDIIVTLGGRDVIDGAGGNDIICAGDGDDQIFGGAGDDTIFGEAGNDTLDGGIGNDRLSGGLGNDLLSGDDGRDRLDGGPGRDRLLGGAGADVLVGGPGRDALRGGPAADTMNGGPGNDLLIGRAGRDHLEGGPGNDRLLGGEHADQLFGGAGDDTLAGGEGSDLLQGGDGSDALFGGPGDDMLSGGAGEDRGDGGPGGDTCLLETAQGCEG